MSRESDARVIAEYVWPCAPGHFENFAENTIRLNTQGAFVRGAVWSEGRSDAKVADLISRFDDLVSTGHITPGYRQLREELLKLIEDEHKEEEPWSM